LGVGFGCSGAREGVNELLNKLLTTETQRGIAATKSRFFATLRSAQNDISAFFACREEVAR